MLREEEECLFSVSEKIYKKIVKKSKKDLDFYTSMGYNNIRKAEVKLLRKEVRKMNEITENQTSRLIEWLKAKGLSDTEIVECMEYINKKG